MACKSPPNFRDLHRKCCQPRDTKETGGLPVRDDHGLYPPALREMLGSDNYQMVLVPRGEWNRIRGSQAEPFSPALAVLLPFSWKEMVARVYEFVRDSNTLAECRVARFEDVCVDFTKDGSESIVGRTNNTDYPRVQNTQMFLVKSGPSVFAGRIAE